jgi:hypothetical protein
MLRLFFYAGRRISHAQQRKGFGGTLFLSRYSPKYQHGSKTLCAISYLCKLFRQRKYLPSIVTP